MHIRLAGDDAVLGRFAVPAAVIAPLTIEVPADVGVRVDEAGKQREVPQLNRRSRAGGWMLNPGDAAVRDGDEHIVNDLSVAVEQPRCTNRPGG